MAEQPGTLVWAGEANAAGTTSMDNTPKNVSLGSVIIHSILIASHRRRRSSLRLVVVTDNLLVGVESGSKACQTCENGDRFEGTGQVLKYYAEKRHRTVCA